MRIAIKRILHKHGYPTDLQLKATETVIEQTKLLANELNGMKIYKINHELYNLMAAEGERDGDE